MIIHRKDGYIFIPLIITKYILLFFFLLEDSGFNGLHKSDVDTFKGMLTESTGNIQMYFLYNYSY